MLEQPLPSGEFEKSESDTQFSVHGFSNPFPGLRPFSIDECHLYFGRENQVDEILVKLSRKRFLTIMGYSGSGKSSLMFCGLIPVLYGGYVTQTGPNWHVIITRPGSSPVFNLAEAIVEYLLSAKRLDASDKELHTRIYASMLHSGPDGLVNVSRIIQQQTGDNIFVLIDQFEEIFRFRESEESGSQAIDEAQHYVNLILTAIDQREVPVYAALTMRSDFIGKCSVFPRLTNLINESNYLVPQMTREQKRMIIEGPILVAGGRISQRLVKKLLSDVGNDQDQLPLLQHALMRTWDYWLANREAGEVIDIRHYNAIGKISQALSLHANEAYDELSTRDKEIAEILFKNITEKNQENRGMRRACRLDLVTELAEANEQEVINVVEQFRKPGRSFLMPAANVPLNGDSLIELSHESLMRIWNRLDGWVEEEFESAQMYKRLSEAAAMYQIGKTGLWRPPDLQLALNWQKKQRPTRAWAQRYDEAFERAIVFLDTSRITYEAELKNQEMMQKRVLRRTRATAVILGIATVVAILFMLFAYMKMIEADKQTERAQQNEHEAKRQTAIAIEERNKADSLRRREVAIREQLEVLTDNLRTTIEERTVAQQRALQSLREAEYQRQLAIEAGNKEKAAHQEADINAKRAEENYNKANRLLMLTKAQAMAVKSRQENDDKDLAGLLSMQAYHFHTRYDGKKYDPYVYAGLYYALTKLSNKSYNAIKIDGPPRNRINSLAISSGTNFYSAGADGRIFKGDYLKLTSQPTAYANPFPNRVIALSNDERYLVNGTDSAFVQVFDLTGSTRRATAIRGFKGGTNDIEFLPDNSSFLVASGNYAGGGFEITTVNLQSGDRKVLVTLPLEVKTISISPNGNWLAGGTWSGKIYLVNLKNATYTTLIEEASSRILSVKYSPDGKSLAYGTDDLVNKRGLVKIYNFSTRETRQFTGHTAGVFDVEFSPDGKLLASAGSDRKLQMWVLEHAEDLPIEMDNNTGFIFDISFTKGSDYLIAATSESEIRVWPTNMSLLAEQICPKLSRNLTHDEWSKYVGDDIGYEITCLRVLIKDY